MASKPAILMRREGSKLVTVDWYSSEKLEAYPEGVDLSVRITSSKRIGALNWYWAGLGLFCENTEDERWPSSRKMHETIMEELGFTTKIWRIDGSFRVVTDSIAIENMGDDEFAIVFEKARAFIVLHFNYDPWEIWMQQAKERRQ